MRASLRHVMLVGALAGLALAPAAQADTFTNPARIQIGDEAPANPWPSAIPVSGMVGEITDIKITLKGLSHTHLDDVGVVAQAPSGQALLLMNGVGPVPFPPSPLSGVIAIDLGLEDDGLLGPLLAGLVPITGSYRPASHTVGLDNFSFGGIGPGTSYANPGPLPAGSATLASAFHGLDPNGSWKLWVHDFALDDVGEIADGWSLDVVTDGTDDTAPVTTITSGPSGTIGTGAASFSFVANDPAATFECKLDAGAWGSCGAPKPYTGLGEGPHTFTVRATDAAGNVELSPPSRTFTVDLADAPPGGGGGGGGGGDGAEADATAPTAQITRVEVTRRKRKAKVSFTGADDTTAANALTFTCALDGKAEAPCSSPAVVKKLKPGRHRIEVRAIDAAGNRSAPAAKRFRVKKP